MLPGRTYSLAEIVAIVRRSRWLIAVPLVAATLTAVGVSESLPDRYRSEALIVVVPQRVPESYVRSTVTTRIEDRLSTLRQQITSRNRLEAIVREFDLYPDLRARLPLEEVVAQMRRSIELVPVRGDAFRVGFVASDARVAQRVAERLAFQFNELNVQDRAVQADATTKFLESQLETARKQLESQEAKLAAFKRSHPGELPTERDANLQVLNGIQVQLQNLIASMGRDRDRRQLLEQQLADLETESQAATAVVVPAPTADQTVVAPGPVAVQLEQARSQLQALELRFKPDHPDIARKRREIRDLEAKLKAEELARPLSPSPTAEKPLTAEETARRNRLRDMRSELASIEIRLRSSLAEETRLQNLIAQYQAKIAAVPTRESEMTALTRDYATSQANYQSLLTRYQESQVAADLERRQIGEQFRIVDEPRVPEAPFSPKRRFILLGGVLAGLAVGFGAVAAKELADRSLRNEEETARVLAVPVLAVVPVLKTKADLARDRRRAAIELTVLAIVAIATVGVVLYLKIGPGIVGSR